MEPTQLEIARTATSEKLPGTAFSTVVLSRAWKYGGIFLRFGESSSNALQAPQNGKQEKARATRRPSPENDVRRPGRWGVDQSRMSQVGT